MDDISKIVSTVSSLPYCVVTFTPAVSAPQRENLMVPGWRRANFNSWGIHTQAGQRMTYRKL
jgi:hypothetical protein